MIGTIGGAVLVAINILFAATLGIVAGGLACLGFRQSWGLKVALLDGILAAFVAVVTAYVVAMIEASRGVWGSRVVILVLAIALGSAVLRHFLQFALRPAH
jgi:hypothetical protein